MVPSLDIFKSMVAMYFGATRWQPLQPPRLASEDLALASPGEFFILDQNTGQRTFVTPLLGSAQIDHPSVESGHHGPRVGMG